MADSAERLLTLDKFLAWEREQPGRYEYANGAITLMAGGSGAHAAIAVNITTALPQALRGSGCRPFASDMKVIASGTVRYPDVSVSCSPVEDRSDRLCGPVLIVEITTQSTEGQDRGRKKFDYFATPSIRQYAIVDQEERRIDLYTRAGDSWTNEVLTGAAVLRLSSVGVELSLDAIYEDTALDPTRRRAAEGSAPAV